MAGKGQGRGSACGETAGAVSMVSELSVLGFRCSARCGDPSPSASNLCPLAVIPDQLPQRRTLSFRSVAKVGTDPFFSESKTSATQYFNDFGCTSSVRQNFLIVAEGDALAEQGSNGFDEFPSLSLDERMGQLRFNREIMVRLELQDKKQAIFDSKMDELLDQISFLVSSVQKLKKSQGGVYQEDPISENSEGQPGEFLNQDERAVVFGNDERNSHLGNGRRSTDCKLSSSLLTSLDCLTNVCEKSSKKSQLFLCEESVVSDPPRARQKSELKNKLSPIEFVDQNFLESNLEISVGVVTELMSCKGEKLMSLYNGFSVRTLTDKQGQEGDDVEVVKLRLNAQPPPEPPPDPKDKAPRYYGLYQMLERVSEVAYRLQLTSEARIHPVFLVSQLKKHVGTQTLISPGPSILLMDETPVPEQILDRRLYPKGRKLQTDILVKWVHSSAEEATWEPYDEMVAKYPTFVLEGKHIC